MLGFGAMRFPCFEDGSVDIEKVKVMIDEFMQAGFCYFDTAYYYHGVKSEGVLNEALVKRYPRESFLIADKMPLTIIKEQADYLPTFNAQLERTGVEYFDFYLLHNLTREQIALTEQRGGFEFIKQMKQEGRVKHIGFSTHDNADALEALLARHPEVEFVQLQVNYLDWNNDMVQSRKCCEVARKYNKPIIVMEPVRGGTLANLPEDARALLDTVDKEASSASFALRYAASIDGVFMVLSGMSTLEQVRDNVRCFSELKEITDEEIKLLERVKEMVARTMLIPCTSCRYCTDGCPKHINIPAFFSGVNQTKLDPLADWRSIYAEALGDGGAPSDCIACGKCKKSCPQNIDIVHQLMFIRL
ncbi:MAG: aldo/keto reductase [Clostridia bacterium]|nr:aldo/keto reductase [Clostridia bacterium]